MRIVRTEKNKYIECDHNCHTCRIKCDKSKRCDNCGENYDTEEYDYCPYCGYDPFVGH